MIRMRGRVRPRLNSAIKKNVLLLCFSSQTFFELPFYRIMYYGGAYVICSYQNPRRTPVFTHELLVLNTTNVPR